MTWAKFHVEKLAQGVEAVFRPKGHSMSGRIESGDQVKVVPISEEPKEGDIVLCKVKGRHYLHLVKAVKVDGDKKLFLIGNNKGGINGWVGRGGIFGRVSEVTAGEA